MTISNRLFQHRNLVSIPEISNPREHASYCVSTYYEKVFVSRPPVTIRIKRNLLRIWGKDVHESKSFQFRSPYRYSSAPPRLLFLHLDSIFSSAPVHAPICSSSPDRRGFTNHSERRSTVNTHLLDHPASSVASYSILWPPMSKRLPGLWNIENWNRILQDLDIYVTDAWIRQSFYICSWNLYILSSSYFTQPSRVRICFTNAETLHFYAYH